MSDKYEIYVGDNIPATSLWVRRDGKEYPIYSNTRGNCSWYTHSINEYANTAQRGLSQAFVDYLAFTKYQADTGGFDPTAQPPENDPKWYEIEILNALGNPGFTKEQYELLEWAAEQSDWKPESKPDE